MLLSETQVSTFEADGFVQLERILDAATVDRLHTRFERLFAGHFETGIQPDEVNWQHGAGDPGLTRQLCNAWKADRAVASVVLRASLGELIARGAA